MKCEDIQEVLFDYMTRELGQARSDLVRAHLRKCSNCQAAARETQETLEFLKSVSKAQTGVPDHLSEKHRARIVRAFMHPALDWIYRHHIIVSIIVALVAIAVTLCVMYKVKMFKDRDIGSAITVTIGRGRPDDGATNNASEPGMDDLPPMPEQESEEADIQR
jgi:predicted anti-sigma-YlaC factor YlaD